MLAPGQSSTIAHGSDNDLQLLPSTYLPTDVNQQQHERLVVVPKAQGEFRRPGHASGTMVRQQAMGATAGRSAVGAQVNTSLSNENGEGVSPMRSIVSSAQPRATVYFFQYPLSPYKAPGRVPYSVRAPAALDLATGIIGFNFAPLSHQVEPQGNRPGLLTFQLSGSKDVLDSVPNDVHSLNRDLGEQVIKAIIDSASMLVFDPIEPRNLRSSPQRRSDET